ncbi:MAG: hypothetical protein OXI87_10270, partial [Albidovulum sp.]|nr:hypothetical protein [Albidovulum sp.]
ALTLCGRETPELDAASFFSDAEIAILEDFATERRMSGPDNLGAAMGLVAAMGGHLHRKHDRPPGSEVVWFGYARLADASQAAGPPALSRRLRRVRRCRPGLRGRLRPSAGRALARRAQAPPPRGACLQPVSGRESSVVIRLVCGAPATAPSSCFAAASACCPGS